MVVIGEKNAENMQEKSRYRKSAKQTLNLCFAREGGVNCLYAKVPGMFSIK